MSKTKKGFVTIPGLLLGGISAIGGFGVLSYLQLKEAIDKGIITIDCSDTMPNLIKIALHAASILPKSFPLKPILQALTGSEADKNKYTKIINDILKYFSVDIGKAK